MLHHFSLVCLKWKLVIIALAISFLAFGQKVTFTEHIAPIIFKNCTPCHQPGQIAPMPFTNYEEVSAYANMIKYVTEIKYMPPWKAINTNFHYSGQRGLENGEIALIQHWINDGLEKGEPGKLVPLSLYDKRPEMKAPDAILRMEEAFEQYGVYYDQFRVFSIPTHFEEDQEISAIEFVPGNTSIVRSCFISVDNTDKVQLLDQWDPQYGYFSFGEIGLVPYESRWYTWNPLKPLTKFPKGAGKFIPKNARLLLHIHYGPTGEPQKDSSYVKIQFAKKPVEKAIHTIPLIHLHNLTNPPFRIPANEKIRYHAKFVVPFDLELRSVMPHSHLLGRRWEIFAVEPATRKTEVLLKIEDWDFKWKQQYEFSQPVILKAGTILHALAEYDNTLENLFNPSDPPHDMEWGKRMFEELFLVYFELVHPVENKKAGVRILSNPVMIASDQSVFQFKTSKKQTLSLVIKDFSNQTQLEICKDKVFSKGTHQVPVSLRDLPKGNYYFELTTRNQTVAGRHIFTFVDRQLFD